VTGRQRQISRQVNGKREPERSEGKLWAEIANGGTAHGDPSSS
jgi:hypothetical protein